MPLIELNARVLPSVGPVLWWKFLNKATQSKEFASPALTVRIVRGGESFSCWKFLFTSPLLMDLLAQSSCCIQEEQVIILDGYELQPFLLLKQYLSRGKLRVNRNLLATETITQLEEMIELICPGHQMASTSSQMTPGPKITGIERISQHEFTDKAVDDDTIVDYLENKVFEIKEDIDGQEDIDGHDLEEIVTKQKSKKKKIIDEQDVEESVPDTKLNVKKRKMTCDYCGFSRSYSVQHAWRFRQHVNSCKMEENKVVDECMMMDEGPRVYNCSICNKSVRDPSRMKTHLILSHYNQELRATCIAPTGEDKSNNPMKQCAECNYTTKTLTSLVVHYGAYHRRLWDVAPKEVMDALPADGRKKKSV